jgi:pre-mRNA-splicing factor 38B
MYQFADNIETYKTNISTTTSALFCCIYRLFTMAIDSRQLKRLIDNTDNPYVRCSGFLFIRFGLPSEQLFPWLGEYLLDDEELRPAKDSEWFTTVGEFVEGLLSQDKYYSTVLPRLPMSTKRQLEAKLAPLIQYRKRTKANLELLDVYRLENVKVEANVNGDWLSGITLELIDDAPSRLKVRVRLEDSSEETVHLGKVILADRRYAGYQGQPVNKRDRSRSRDRTDWARDKGRPDKTLVDELRTKDREKAVCSSGKEYARKPLGYKASCALPREQGTASTRLMEEETFVPMKSMRRRSPSPATKEQEFRKAPSQEHQQRMQQLFEKYGMSKSQESASSNRDVEGPDMMRLG